MLLQLGRHLSQTGCQLPLFSGLEPCCGAHGCPSIAKYDLIATSAVMPVFLSGATAVHRAECTVDHFHTTAWDP